jgi:hypothetical protein
MRFPRLVALVLPLATGAPAAHAEELPRTVGSASTRAALRPKEPPAEANPPPALRLAIDATTTRGAWTMLLTNDGDVPVRIVADARLLSLDVSPRSARAPVRCELPDDMRPAGDLDRVLIVPPKRSYAEYFEPRLYCFGPGKLDALVPGAIVVARLGWSNGPKGGGPPFEASPIEGVEPQVAPMRSVESLPIALPDERTAWVTAPQIRPDLAADPPRLSLQAATSVDAIAPNDITIPVTLRNDGTHAVTVRFRPEVIGFDIAGPNGVERCAWPAVPAAAMREMFTTLAPKESATLELTPSSYCTGHGLDRSGLILVRPRLDTRNASGAAVGLRTFDGEVTSTTTTIVRLHRGAAPPPPVLPLPYLSGAM